MQQCGRRRCCQARCRGAESLACGHHGPGLTDPSSRGLCSPGRGSWSFGVKQGLGDCSGWSCWKLWNALANQSPLHHSPLRGRHFLGPYLPMIKSPLRERALAVASRCSFLQRIPSLAHCHSGLMTVQTGHCWHSWSGLVQGGTW